MEKATPIQAQSGGLREDQRRHCDALLTELSRVPDSDRRDVFNLTAGFVAGLTAKSARV